MEPSFLPGLLFLFLSLGCLLMLMTGLFKTLRKTGWNKMQQQKSFVAVLIIALGWLTLVGILADTGFFKSYTFPPRLVIAVLIPVTVLFLLSFTPKFKTLLTRTPPQWLLVLQSFRIPVELVIWLCFMRGLMPEAMTFEGRNIDMLAGILGPVAGWLFLKYKSNGSAILLTYNLTGLATLLNVVITAVRMFTFPEAGLAEPENAIIATFPYIYLPGMLVVTAMTLHLLSLRQWYLLYIKKTATRAAVS